MTLDVRLNETNLAWAEKFNLLEIESAETACYHHGQCFFFLELKTTVFCVFKSEV